MLHTSDLVLSACWDFNYEVEVEDTEQSNTFDLRLASSRFAIIVIFTFISNDIDHPIMYGLSKQSILHSLKYHWNEIFISIANSGDNINCLNINR